MCTTRERVDTVGVYGALCVGSGRRHDHYSDGEADTIGLLEEGLKSRLEDRSRLAIRLTNNLNMLLIVIRVKHKGNTNL